MFSTQEEGLQPCLFLGKALWGLWWDSRLAGLLSPLPCAGCSRIPGDTVSVMMHVQQKSITLCFPAAGCTDDKRVRVVFGSDFYVVSHCAEASQPFGLTKSSKMLWIHISWWIHSSETALLGHVTPPPPYFLFYHTSFFPSFLRGADACSWCLLESQLCAHVSRTAARPVLGQSHQSRSALTAWLESALASAPHSIPLWRVVEHDLVLWFTTPV